MYDPPIEPPGASEIQQAEDDEMAKLRAMLETYRCDNGIPQPVFTDYLVTVALREHLDQMEENGWRQAYHALTGF